jgi:uncharacterized protein YjiS (DUF1127 family)
MLLNMSGDLQMTDIFFTCTERTGFKPVVRLAHAGSFIARAYERYRQRQALAQLDDSLLADLGLSRQDVTRECAKSWWPV